MYESLIFNKNHLLITSTRIYFSMVSLIDMTLGMILGMVLSPIMMRLIKDFRQRIKVKRILKEYANNKKNEIIDESNKN